MCISIKKYREREYYQLEGSGWNLNKTNSESRLEGERKSLDRRRIVG